MNEWQQPLASHSPRSDADAAPNREIELCWSRAVISEFAGVMAIMGIAREKKVRA